MSRLQVFWRSLVIPEKIQGTMILRNNLSRLIYEPTFNKLFGAFSVWKMPLNYIDFLSQLW